MNGRTLGSVADQRVLRVQVHGFLKLMSQLGEVVKKTLGTSGFIRQRTE